MELFTYYNLIFLELFTYHNLNFFVKSPAAIGYIDHNYAMVAQPESNGESCNFVRFVPETNEVLIFFRVYKFVQIVTQLFFPGFS